MHNGWIKLWRKSVDSPSFKNPLLWHFWEYCLLKASHREIKIMIGFQEIQLLPGQFIYGRQKASTETGLSERNCRTCLKNLEKSGNLTSKVTNKFSIITIINWATYQGNDYESDQQSDQQVTSKRPASDQQVTTYKNDKNVKNDKKKKHSSPRGEVDDYFSYRSKKGRIIRCKKLRSFDLFWDAFNYKHGRAEAADAWLDIIGLNKAILDRIIDRAGQEAKARPDLIASGKTPKMAQGWLSGRRWEDEAGPGAIKRPDPEAERLLIEAKKRAENDARIALEIQVEQAADPEFAARKTAIEEFKTKHGI